MITKKQLLAMLADVDDDDVIEIVHEDAGRGESDDLVTWTVSPTKVERRDKLCLIHCD